MRRSAPGQPPGAGPRLVPQCGCRPRRRSLPRLVVSGGRATLDHYPAGQHVGAHAAVRTDPAGAGLSRSVTGRCRSARNFPPYGASGATGPGGEHRGPRLTGARGSRHHRDPGRSGSFASPVASKPGRSAGGGARLCPRHRPPRPRSRRGVDHRGGGPTLPVTVHRLAAIRVRPAQSWPVPPPAEGIHHASHHAQPRPSPAPEWRPPSGWWPAAPA